MSKLLTVLLLALVATFAFAEILEEESVQVVTDDNIQEIISQEFVLVEFYAPWCGHCKKLAPEYAKAAAQLKTLEKPIPLAKCDATSQKAAAAPYGVKGFPTLKFFSNGNAIDYNGGRTASDIVNWITKRTGDVSKLVSDQAALDALKQANKLVLVLFTEQVSGEAWEAFKIVALKYDNVVFAHSTDAALARANQAQFPQLVLFKQFDEGRNDYTGEWSDAAISEWVDANKLATVMEFDDGAIEAVFQKQLPTLFLFQNDAEESKQAKQVFDQVAKQLRGQGLLFAYLTPSSQHWQRLADYIGVNTAVVPAIQLVRASKSLEKYRFESEITVSNLVQFVDDWKNEKLTPFVKSEEVPETNDKPVKVIVGKNFDDLVVNSNKDVLLKFYAPWCGHCKKLIPDWEKAAELLEVNPNIVIAKCDATANEIPSVQIQGYPTLKFYPNGAKTQPIDFNGDRTVEGILNFLKEKTTYPWVEVNFSQEQEQQQQQQQTTETPQQQQQGNNNKRDDL